MKLQNPPIVRRDPKTGLFDLTKESRTKRVSDTITISGGGIDAVVLNVEFVAVASARTEMPGLIRASAESGRVFLIRNAKDPSAASALLINPEVLQERFSKRKPSRTLGELLESLPFKRREAPRVMVSLPNDVAPKLRIHGTEGFAATSDTESHAGA